MKSIKTTHIKSVQPTCMTRMKTTKIMKETYMKDTEDHLHEEHE